MTTLTVDPAKAVTGPGIVLAAPLATADPTHVVAGSVFTDDWASSSGWALIGATREGFDWSQSIATEQLEVAESLDTFITLVTGRTTGARFEMAYLNRTNLGIAMNGGTNSTVSGSGATLLSKYVPPTLSGVVRRKIGWESDDHTVRWIGYQALNTGDVNPQHRKNNYAGLPTDWSLEIPSGGGDVWAMLFAGATRSA